MTVAPFVHIRDNEMLNSSIYLSFSILNNTCIYIYIILYIYIQYTHVNNIQYRYFPSVSVNYQKLSVINYY